MNEIELIYNGKIIKFNFEKVIIINSEDSDFYSLLIDSLKGKISNSFYNRRIIEKNEFNVYEISGDSTLSDEFKYNSKSFILKRIQNAIEDRECFYSHAIEQINESIKVLNSELNSYLRIDPINVLNDLSTIEIIKKLYNPVAYKVIEKEEEDIALFRNVFEYCNGNKSFIILNLNEGKKDLLTILKLINVVEEYNNIQLIIIERDINNLYNLSFAVEIYLSSIYYAGFNDCIESFESVCDCNIDCSSRMFLLNSIIHESNDYGIFLKNHSINAKMIELINNFKNYFSLKNDKKSINID